MKYSENIDLYEKFRALFPSSRNSTAWLWVEYAQDMARPNLFNLNPEELGNKFYEQFVEIQNQFSGSIANTIYDSIHEGTMLPNEMIAAAEYLRDGGYRKEIVEMARNGAFENHMGEDWLEPVDQNSAEEEPQLGGMRL